MDKFTFFHFLRENTELTNGKYKSLSTISLLKRNSYPKVLKTLKLRRDAN